VLHEAAVVIDESTFQSDIDDFFSDQDNICEIAKFLSY
jgi:hypothetical protein